MNKFLTLLSLSKLINELNNHGFVLIAQDLNKDLYELIEEQENDDLSALINSVGLQEGSTPNIPWGSFTVSPFFF